MLYTPQRRHVVSNISASVQILNLTQHLLTPNVLILGMRIASMIQINAAGFLHPERSLLLLSLLITALNIVAASLHLLEWGAGSLGGVGLILDFIGQSRPPSVLHVLYLDALVWGMQMTALVISYVNNRGNPNPLPTCPWKDPLLPSRELEDEVVEDMEDGLRAKDDIVDEELWLDEQEAELDEADERGTLLEPSRSRRRRETPLILSLSLSHILHVIYRLPTPLAASNVTSSIIADPPASPILSVHSDSEETIRGRPSRDDSSPTEAEVGVGEEGASGVEQERPRQSAERTRPTGRGGRIPGDYWVSGPDRP